MAVKKWIQPMMKKAKQKGTVGIFKRKAKQMGISTRALAKRWYSKTGVWGKRARAASHMMRSSRPKRTRTTTRKKRTTRR